MEVFTVFTQVLVLFILMMIGYIVRRLNIVDSTFSKNLSNFLFAIILPAMIINSMNFPFSIKVLIDGGWLIIISMGVMLFSVIISMIAIKFFKVDILSENVYYFGLIFSNFSFMGFPVISAIYGQEGVLYTSIFILVIRILFNTVGVAIMQRGSGGKDKIQLKNILNPPIIAVFIGLTIFLFKIQIPKPIAMSLSMLSSAMTPLGMIVIGLILANQKFTQMFSDVKVYIASFIRLIFIPVCLLIPLKMLGFDSLIVGVPVIVTAMPMAATASILAEKYNGNSYLGAQCMFVSSLLSIITIPLIVFLVI
ncbi:MAG: AEC family transporter [Clostridia bacterium]